MLLTLPLLHNLRVPCALLAPPHSAHALPALQITFWSQCDCGPSVFSRLIEFLDASAISSSYTSICPPSAQVAMEHVLHLLSTVEAITLMVGSVARLHSALHMPSTVGTIAPTASWAISRVGAAVPVYVPRRRG